MTLPKPLVIPEEYDFKMLVFIQLSAVQPIAIRIVIDRTGGWHIEKAWSSGW